MKYMDAVKYCLNKIGAKDEYIFSNKIKTFTVGGKQFCRVYEVDGKKGFVLKSDPELNIALRQMYEGILLPGNLDNLRWNLVLLEEDVPDDEIKFLIDQSYNIMFNSLSKKKQRELVGD